jgi:hypothetical protein
MRALCPTLRGLIELIIRDAYRTRDRDAFDTEGSQARMTARAKIDSQTCTDHRWCSFFAGAGTSRLHAGLFSIKILPQRVGSMTMIRTTPVIAFDQPRASLIAWRAVTRIRCRPAAYLVGVDAVRLHRLIVINRCPAAPSTILVVPSTFTANPLSCHSTV